MPNEINLALQADYFWALLPEIVLTLGAMAVLLADVFMKGNQSRPSSPMIPWLSLGVLGLTALANVLLFGMRDVSTTGMVAVDAFRAVANYIFLLSAALTLLISIGYLDRKGINRGEFHALVLFATLGMMLMAGARDLMMVFIGLEVMSVSIYVLVGFDRLDPRSSEASLKYFLLGAFSSAFFLYGIALVFGATGSTHLHAIQGALAGGGVAEDARTMLLAGVALTLVGFGFKVAAIPFHMWTPDAYDGAPTPVTALMSTGVKAAAFASFIRVFFLAFIDVSEVWVHAVWWLAALTMFGGNLMALTQGSVKRMLAYSSIAHAGYLLVALLSRSPSGASAFVFYLIVYTLMTVGAFGIVIANSNGAEERVTLEDYAGLARERPGLAAVFAIFLLSLAGFPLTAGFLGKLYILQAAVGAGQVEISFLLVIASLVSYFYYLRVVVVMYMRPPRHEGAHASAGLSGPAHFAVVASAVAVVALFFLGGVRGGPLEWAQRSASSLWATPQAQVQPEVVRVSGPVGR